jgi:glycosyltransferase involved in cell wall biosynthesis
MKINWSFLKGINVREKLAGASNKVGLFPERLRNKISDKQFFLAMPGFDEVLKKIVTGIAIHPNEILPYLAEEKVNRRIFVNWKLAEAFISIAKYRQAAIFVKRAWFFSGYDDKYLPLLVEAHTQSGDVEAVRYAYKQTGIRKAAENDIDAALHYFNLWHYAYANYNKNDEYYYDDEVLGSIQKLASLYCFPKRKQKNKSSKIKIAYLLYGMDHLGSVIVKIALSFAQFHDKSKFEIAFFAPLTEEDINTSPEAIDSINRIRESGSGFFAIPASQSKELSQNQLLNLANLIYEFNANILVTTAGLADFKHLFIVETRPAPLVMGLCQGPPPQFIAPSFDWAISWTKHPLIDCPVNCSLVRLATDLPARSEARVECDYFEKMPDDAVILMSCGRATKFQNVEFWQAIIRLIDLNENAYFVAVGLALPPPWLDVLLSNEKARGRIKFINWQKDYLTTLAMADILIDTYPSGGGVTVVDAMAMGVVVVSYENNYLNEFTQTDWSPAGELMGIAELTLRRGDFSQLTVLLSRLISDAEYREHLAQLCVTKIREDIVTPRIMVKECEDVYLKVAKIAY